MANSLRAERGLGQVSSNWPSTFVKRRPELQTKFNRKYDYKRALCEDPEVIRDWFRLVENMKAKHSILDNNMYNFNERVTGAYRLLIIDGHESHDSLEFQQYCKDNKIITICMPPHSSHLLQPLDVGSEELMRNRITHITKLEFLPCFKRAFNAAITPSNIQGGFRGARLVPFNPERVILALNQSQTPSNTLELGSQSTLVKARIQRHVDSSPTSIVEAFEKVSKGAAIIAHKLVLAQKEIAELRAANKAATRRKSHKRKRVQEEETLTVEDGLRQTTLKEFGARSDRKKAKKQVRAGAGEPSQRRCRRYNKTGHNARTCKKAVEVDSE
ncbi:hypothetical protein HBI58_041530 [Parastagonospora nodorum]|nr:hypothetical protein HBI58_041530 [Parastagonospora nodorum]